MKILISGGAGFIGSHTVDLLIANGHRVYVVDNFSTGRSENLEAVPAKICSCDITDLDVLEGCFYQFKPEAVIHLAAQSAISTARADPQRDCEVNAIGTLNMLKLAIKYDCKRFVFSSTSAVYNSNQHVIFGMSEERTKCDPSTPYGISKLAAEHYVRTMFPNHIILRYANIYGPRQRPLGENQVIARAFNHFLNGEYFAVHGHGRQKRDFVYVGDIAYANFMAVMWNHVGTFNAASGRSISVNDVLSTFAESYDVPEYRWEHTSENDPRGDVHMNASKIRRELGWRPYVSLREGIAKTAKWWEGEKC